ncbi:MAG: GNAT family N-acetyltransferase [Blastocatellia bacterium]|nr:GNAT family N-acetyltransferase [Blastocatellia bacterium]
MIKVEEFPFVDLNLARRLERTEAQVNAEMVEARAKIFPDSNAQWIEVAGAYAMYDGLTSPLTQTFGLGIFGSITEQEIGLIEDFYNSLSAPIFHEVSPLADLTLLPLLNNRGYQPIEFTSVMFRPISHNPMLEVSSNIQVRLIEESEQDLWAATSAKGWSEFTEYADLMFDLAQVSAKRRGALSFIAELEGQPIATGAVGIFNGVALLAGASTIVEGRRQGAQQALLNSRLNYAVEQGCDIAMVCAQPGSVSQRNAERQGFRIAYTRVKWRLARAV